MIKSIFKFKYLRLEYIKFDSRGLGFGIEYKKLCFSLQSSILQWNIALSIGPDPNE